MMPLSFTRNLLSCATLLAIVSGCGPSLTPPPAAVEVTVKVTMNSQPVSNVSMTLQPLEGGRQAVAEVVGGKFAASVVPGTYTYYVDRGRTDADLNKIPESYRLGSMDRKLVIEQPGTYEATLN